MTASENERVSQAIEREQPRLLRFVRRRVDEMADAEDIVQDVFGALIETLEFVAVDRIGPWLFRAARNRIVDFYRARKPETSASEPAMVDDEGSTLSIEDLLPTRDAGPEALYARGLLLEEIDDALDELPEEQRDVFVAHELEGRSFKEISAATGVSVNTLLSRKHYAVLHLRERLQAIYDEFRSDL
jgi:RNA polymerase sigma factor (sigma-70 family)